MFAGGLRPRFVAHPRTILRVASCQHRVAQTALEDVARIHPREPREGRRASQNLSRKIRARCQVRPSFKKEASFNVVGFQYFPNTGEIWFGGRRRDCSDGNYRIVISKRIRIAAHRLAWRLHYGEWPTGLIDHRDLDKQNNRISNLRPATYSQNEQNKPASGRSKTGQRGVYFDAAKGRWRFKVKSEGKCLYYTASHKLSAILACAIVRRAVHGKFAFQIPT